MQVLHIVTVDRSSVITTASHLRLQWLWVREWPLPLQPRITQALTDGQRQGGTQRHRAPPSAVVAAANTCVTNRVD